MSELEIWQTVNECENIDKLKYIIKATLSDENGMIQGRTRKFSAEKMAMGLDMFMKDEMPSNVITRDYGLRQQAIYLKIFNQQHQY